MKNIEKTVQFIRSLYNQPDDFIPLHAPVFKGNETKYLLDCIDSTFVSSVGKFVDQFEEEIAKFTGSKKAVACVNGTNALHLALILIGVERDTEVITQPLTFVATANAIAYCGANPVFLDVDLDTMGLSPGSLNNWLNDHVVVKEVQKQLKPFNKTTGKRISACIPMHTYGHPVKIEQIVSICHDFKIPVVEDAAESLGSYYKNRHTGTFGEIGILSFNGNKILTTGGGGMMLFQNDELALKARHLTTQAKIPHPWEFSHDEIGYNYRMPNLNAALGLAQLEQLSEFLISKRKIAQAYIDFFNDMEFEFIIEPVNSTSNYWLNSVLLRNAEEKNDFLKYANSKKVMTRPAWKLMNDLPNFSNCQKDELKNARLFNERLINIPSSAMER